MSSHRHLAATGAFAKARRGAGINPSVTRLLVGDRHSVDVGRRSNGKERRMTQRIRKAIFPVGGLGTRFLPATKAMPKEMMPVVDKPLVQYAVEEAQAAGIEEIIFVTSRDKAAIEDHFDQCGELEGVLVSRGKTVELEAIRRGLPMPGQIAYTRQPRPLGLGHAVWCARNLVGDEPFAVLLADDLIMAEPPCLRQMIDAHDEVGGNVVAVMEVPAAHVNRYGILDAEPGHGPLVRARGLVEKPSPARAPSRLAVVGRYILDPRLFDRLDRLHPGAAGEIQLTDGIAQMMSECPLHGLKFSGQRFDCGDKIGLFEAGIAYALSRADVAPAAMKVLRRYAAGDAAVGFAHATNDPGGAVELAIKPRLKA
jgi:UTP--glucose-1-phosphate uridylyltransferase